MPRFWIHDSPRAADTEDHLYHAIMEIVADFEKLTEPNEPIFQHIWTTTTPPPKKLDNDTYVRDRLHARSSEGKLLKKNF